MRIAIYGTGGAGGYFGAQLARSREDVTFVARGQHLEAIQAHGLCVETPAGEIVIQPAKATDDPTLVAPVDVVLLGVKAWQVEEAARNMRPMVGPATFVVPLQNGVDAVSQLAAVLGPEHVLGGLCGTFSWVAAPGKIRSISTASFIKFGELDNGRRERVERLRQAFGRTDVKADIPADIHKALWEKFLLVTAFGGVGAVSRAPIGIIRIIPETRALLQQCVEEVASVARARGIKLDDTVVTDTMRYVDSLAANAATSLQRDIAEGKPSEIVLLERFGGAARIDGKGLDPCKPIHLSQSAAAGIASTRQHSVSPMSRAKFSLSCS
jgi:2-dehydropantoate 2-reductase